MALGSLVSLNGPHVKMNVGKKVPFEYQCLTARLPNCGFSHYAS